MSSTALYITLSKIPVWVWPLLIVLIIVGITASRDRSVSIRFFWFLPLIGLMVVPTLLRIGKLEIIPVFLLAYGLGALAGKAFQKRVLVKVENGRAHLRGEWVTMMAVMAMFIANFAFGIMSGIAPETAQGVGVLIPFLAVIGFCSGSFLGRSMFVIASCHSVKQVV